MSVHHVVLIPGFFGFGSLGELTYFYGVKRALERAFDAQGLAVNVVEAPTLPTASIRHRAARVHETLAQVARSGPGPIHVIGHSTGGLDARLAIAPTASLPIREEFVEHERLRTLVTISTPHFGTPLASFFGSAAGHPLLKAAAASVATSLRHGHLPLGWGFKIGRWLVRADDWLGYRNTVADQFFEAVISDFSPERRAELIAFLECVSNDQSLIFQLTPAGCDLVNACTADPAELRYGSVVCRARAPRVSNLLTFRHDPYAQVMHAFFALLYGIVARPAKQGYPEPVPEQRAVLERAFGEAVRPSWSDGIVPTLSQIWGQVIHATDADHLDVVGHYGAKGSSPGADWLPSNSGFDESRFESLWSAVARFITEEARQGDVPRRRRNVGVERTQVEVEDASPVEPPVVTAEQQAREALSQVFAAERSD